MQHNAVNKGKYLRGSKAIIVNNFYENHVPTGHATVRPVTLPGPVEEDV